MIDAALAAALIVIALSALAWFALDIVDRRQENRRARHMREAIDLTRPVGPEDRDDWGTRE
jgi:hypothetical protein